MPTNPLILITRELSDSVRFAEQLGCPPEDMEIMPLFSVNSLRPPPPDDYLNMDGMILTSRHAIAYLSQHPVRKNMPFYVVGEATKQSLHSLGYTHVQCCVKNAIDLLAELGSFSDQRLIYLRGKEVTTDIPATLSSIHHITPIIVYEIGKTHLNTDILLSTLHSRSVIILPLFSSLSATHVSDILANIDNHSMRKIIPVTISQAVTQAIQHYPWMKIISASTADLQSVAKMVMLEFNHNKTSSTFT